MNSTELKLSPIPENERSPLVESLIKFINWQTLRITDLEKENHTLHQKMRESNFLPKKINDGDSGVTRENVKKRNEKRAASPENRKRQTVWQKDKNKRQFTRLNLKWDVRLDFGSREYQHSVRDISISGIYIKGCCSQQIVDIYTINLDQSASDATATINAIGSVARINDHGMALEFNSMKLEDFFSLQTTLLYEAGEPAVVGTEFVKNIDLELEGDIILCAAYNNSDKDKKNEDI